MSKREIERAVDGLLRTGDVAQERRRPPAKGAGRTTVAKCVWDAIFANLDDSNVVDLIYDTAVDLADEDIGREDFNEAYERAVTQIRKLG